MAYHSDEIPIDSVLSFTGLLPMHCAYSNSNEPWYEISNNVAF